MPQGTGEGAPRVVALAQPPGSRASVRPLQPGGRAACRCPFWTAGAPFCSKFAESWERSRHGITALSGAFSVPMKMIIWFSSSSVGTVNSIYWFWMLSQTCIPWWWCINSGIYCLCACVYITCVHMHVCITCHICLCMLLYVFDLLKFYETALISRGYWSLYLYHVTSLSWMPQKCWVHRLSQEAQPICHVPEKFPWKCYCFLLKCLTEFINSTSDRFLWESVGKISIYR